MFRVKRYVRTAVAVLGLAMVAASGIAVYIWHYQLAPMRHLADPVWVATHSEAARWAEEQENYRRIGASPDLFWRGDRIGVYGNKEWFLWLEERLRNARNFRRCGCTRAALELMANRRPTSLHQWTAANRERSQEEWIKDGFLDHGVTVHLPPTPDDTVPLLKLLGQEPGDELQAEDTPDHAPGYVRYNAFRWLRDSGFDPLKFTLSNAALAAQPDISAGLQAYAQWQAAYPSHNGLGVLAFGQHEAEDTDLDWDWVAPIAKPWFAFSVNAVIVICALGGILLTFYAMKRKPNVTMVEQGATPDGAYSTPETRPDGKEGLPSEDS